jgi:hypothetical protein
MREETLDAERVEELFADVRMFDGTADGVPRASVRPEGTPPAPSRNNAAAATQSEPSRRPGGPA